MLVPEDSERNAEVIPGCPSRQPDAGSGYTETVSLMEILRRLSYYLGCGSNDIRTIKFLEVTFEEEQPINNLSEEKKDKLYPTLPKSSSSGTFSFTFNDTLNKGPEITFAKNCPAKFGDKE